MGTFNVRLSRNLFLLLPGAFSVEPVSFLPGTECHSLALADLGALTRGAPETPRSGKIKIELGKDEQRPVLMEGDNQQVVRSYSVGGKVLAADLLDPDKLQNHFLLSTAALGGQLLRAHDLGPDAQGNMVPLDPERISAFFFDVLNGRIAVSSLDARFSLAEMVGNLR